MSVYNCICFNSGLMIWVAVISIWCLWRRTVTMETIEHSNYSELCEEEGTQNLTSQQYIEEKPLICRICNIAFSCQHDLQRHNGCHEKKKHTNVTFVVKNLCINPILTRTELFTLEKKHLFVTFEVKSLLGHPA